MMSRFATTRPCLLAIALLTVGSSAAITQENETQWTPELSMKYHAIQGTVMSPDGRYVAYVIRKPIMEGEKSEYLSHIWIVTADGERNIQYTHGEKSDGSPSFSPDGHYLAFTSSRSGSTQVWVMPLTGGEVRQITEADPGVGTYRCRLPGRGRPSPSLSVAVLGDRCRTRLRRPPPTAGIDVCSC